MRTIIKERPILFSGEAVRAILDGKKTQVRRVAKPPAKAVFLPGDRWRIDPDEPGTAYTDDESGRLRITCHYGEPCDRLWVQEVWSDAMSDAGPVICYKANLDRRYLDLDSWPVDYDRYPGCKFANWASDLEGGIEGLWRTGTTMPRWASRVTLQIVGVRIERLRDIGLNDIVAEGVPCPYETPVSLQDAARLRADFKAHWNKAVRVGGSWDENPWVWALSFRRLEPEQA